MIISRERLSALRQEIYQHDSWDDGFKETTLQIISVMLDNYKHTEYFELLPMEEKK